MSEREQTFIVGIFGDNYEQMKLIGQFLGSPDTKTDLQVFERLDTSSGYVFSAICPVDYPEKIKAFLQTLILTDIYILVIDLERGLNPGIGEILIGLDLMCQHYPKTTLIVISNISSATEWKLPETLSKLNKIIGSTRLKNCPIIEIKSKEDLPQLKTSVIEWEKNISEGEKNETSKEYSKVMLDHIFPVKGVGTVALGFVKKGQIDSCQMLEILVDPPLTKKIVVRNIQKHDRNFKRAFEGDRVGLALKGVSPKEISRENILASPGIFTLETRIHASLQVNQFFKPKNGTIKPGEETQYHAIVDLKTSPLKIIGGEPISPGSEGEVEFEFERPLYHDGRGLRGLLVNFNQFTKQSRIIGYFEQLTK